MSAPSIDRQRLWDLVRYQCQELFLADIITAEELTLLVMDRPAVARLESYDELREKVKGLLALLAIAKPALRTFAMAYEGGVEEIISADDFGVAAEAMNAILEAERSGVLAEKGGAR